MGGVIEGLTEKIVENTLGTEDESAEEKTRFTNGHERPALAHSNQFEMHGGKDVRTLSRYRSNGKEKTEEARYHRKLTLNAYAHSRLPREAYGSSPRPFAIDRERSWVRFQYISWRAREEVVVDGSRTDHKTQTTQVT